MHIGEGISWSKSWKNCVDRESVKILLKTKKTAFLRVKESKKICLKSIYYGHENGLREGKSSMFKP